MTRAPATKIRALAARIDAATPAHRDRTVDALRALAICGVILGHWLVTALVLTPGGTLRDASPLASIPALTPASWIFQTLAVFFCVGGYASARSYRGGYLAWLRQRLTRLSRPVAALAAVWVLLGSGMWLAGVSGSTLHTVLTLVLDPLWFLGVYAVLTALTPVAVTLVRRFGAAVGEARRMAIAISSSSAAPILSSCSEVHSLIAFILSHPEAGRCSQRSAAASIAKEIPVDFPARQPTAAGGQTSMSIRALMPSQTRTAVRSIDRAATVDRVTLTRASQA